MRPEPGSDDGGEGGSEWVSLNGGLHAREASMNDAEKSNVGSTTDVAGSQASGESALRRNAEL